jgi:hypothetical protein
MSELSALPDVSRYEQACDQAIAMCDGNLRSTMIMANEYLEAELQELQAALDNGAREDGRKPGLSEAPQRKAS